MLLYYLVKENMIMIWIIAGVAILVLLILWFIGVANKLVRKKAEVDNAFADIDVYLTKRFDLIPNLVNTVKGYTKHEKDTFEAVVEARTKGLNAGTINEKVEADEQLTSALGRLIAVAEAYPELKANENFLKLQDSLQETEEKIAYSRQFYNDNAKSYRNLVEMFPSNIVARLFGFTAMPFFEASADEKVAPQVKF